MWLLAAIGSAVFAGLTSILAKCGLNDTDSDIATALRTIVVLVFAWLMAGIVGSVESITTIDAKSLLFLVLSGLATGASWLCYFKALSLGDVNKVAPIDKSSTVLTILGATFFLGENAHLALKLMLTALLAAGIFLMIDEHQSSAQQPTSLQSTTRNSWIIYALFSATFAAATAILAKVGITHIESNLGTAIRTCVVLVMAWGIVFMRGKQNQLKSLNHRELLFIILSGLATGASWLCYYYAIQNGMVSIVVPIDKLSILVTIAFSGVVFYEKLSRKAALGLILMSAATIAMAIWL
ncbi:EamA family transporter [Atopobium sp. oral taxon 810]|uniref:EamA family transporter n=1 Tax=Atopobium sp. oral taxon 810 TaxID=712158 RepID=UPI000397C53E|nr:EamA family transporter [Atopobium sp. oral taxon 810]ERI06561.1 putative membrane protein [Atopobium sp. oral taxon 810 str. F0209]